MLLGFWGGLFCWLFGVFWFAFFFWYSWFFLYNCLSNKTALSFVYTEHVNKAEETSRRAGGKQAVKTRDGPCREKAFHERKMFGHVKAE